MEKRITYKELVGVNCPKCLPFVVVMEFLDKRIVSKSVEKRCYLCKVCNTRFERLIMRDSIGLIKTDSLCELDKEGYHLEVWK